MYVKITKNLRAADTLRYHENKLAIQQASCIHAENYIKDASELTWEDKLYPFLRSQLGHEKVQVTILHFSINFHSLEKFTDQKMAQLAREYMERLGLGRQPYLVYRHFDSGHPHVHVVCPKIWMTGGRIDTTPATLRYSAYITREMELAHGLTQNGDRQSWTLAKTEKARAKKVDYGKVALIPSMDIVMRQLIKEYQFTSLAEYNVLLRLYNMKAIPIRQNIPQRDRSGLIYVALNDEGKRISHAVSASQFEIKPTYPNLVKQFRKHIAQRQLDGDRLKASIAAPIEMALFQRKMDMPMLVAALKEKGITVVIDKDKKGVAQQIYYINHVSKVVYSGADLGERYTLKAIQQRCPELTTAQREELAQQQQQQIQQQSQRHLPSGL